MATETLDILDVTQIEPRLKHPTIFQRFHDLQEGEAFVIHNDHDPKPLYYHLLAEHGNIFSWEYLEQGPQWWKVRIVKKILPNGNEAETIGDMAAKDLRKAEVFKKFGLEFCCDGRKPLSEACKDAGVQLSEVEKALENLDQVDAATAPGHDYYSWDLDFLCDYIVNVHHKFVRENATMISDLSEKIAQHHGDSHPELYEIKAHVAELLTELASHQGKEENILFPFIKKMVESKKTGAPLDNPSFGTVESPVNMMMHDHRFVADNVHAIDKLSSNYQVPADGCDSYRLFFHKLEALDKDLHLHLHLENNILFPKAIQLEKKLN